MRLLIITQKVDRTDPILGFFHRWIEGFSKHCDGVTVVGQCIGMYDLPGTTVLGLRKEHGCSRPGQILRFWTLLWAHRNAYDVAFIHMTPVWVVLGAPLFWILGKRIYLWYEARGGGVWLRLAALIARTIFSASKAGMPIKTPKSMIVGHGIDTEVFRPQAQMPTPGNNNMGRQHFLVTVGRVTAAKRLEIMVDALSHLPGLQLEIVGVPLTDADQAYLIGLLRGITERKIADRIIFRALPPAKIPSLLQNATVFLHASETALDKALLEAMACGCPVVSCADAARDLLPEECWATPGMFVDRIQAMLALPSARRAEIGTKLRSIVEKEHGLSRLIEKLVAEMSSRIPSP